MRTDGLGDTTPKRVVIYCRVSTEDQAQHGYSLDSQLKECQDYAARERWVVVGHQQDEGISGASLDRPGLDRIREMARDREVDVLLTYDLDRLSRKLAYQILIEEELSKVGVAVCYVRGDYGHDEEGRLAKNVRAAIAEYERAKILERTERGKLAKARTGLVVGGGRIAYGYWYGDGALHVEPDKARVVERIFDLYANQDRSIRQIVQALSEEGITTYSGNEHWARSSVHRILENETYAGTTFYNRTGRASEHGPQMPRPRDEWIDIPVPAIVSPATWQRAHDRLEHNRKFARGQRRHQYLLSGFLVCEGCGFAYGGEFSKGVRRYRDGGHKHPTLRADTVEGAVWTAVRGLLLSPQTMYLGYEGTRQKALEDAQRLDKRLGGIYQSMEKDRSKLDALTELFIEGDLTKDEYRSRKGKIKTHLTRLENEARELAARRAAGAPSADQWRRVEDFAAAVSTGIDALTFEEKRKVFQLLNLQGRVSHPQGKRPLVELQGAFPLWATEGMTWSGVLSTSSARCGRQQRLPQGLA
jgi:site-specific DNA recombinase